jgi:hypothetical protein
MTRRSLAIALVSLLLGATAAGAAGVSVASRFLATQTRTLTHATCTLQPASVDTYVNEASKNSSFSASTSFVTNSANSQRQRPLLTFTLSGCGSHLTTGNPQVDAATITVIVASASGGTRTLTVYRVTSAWSSSVTWNTQPTIAGSATATFTASLFSLGAKTIDVTNDVVDFVHTSPTVLPPYSSAVTNLGWEMQDLGSTSGTVSMSSSEASTTTSRPKLVIDYAY